VSRFNAHEKETHIYKWIANRNFWTILFGGIIAINLLVRFAWPWIVVLGKAIGIPLPDEVMY
jgi:hypothetical protein